MQHWQQLWQSVFYHVLEVHKAKIPPQDPPQMSEMNKSSNID